MPGRLAKGVLAVAAALFVAHALAYRGFFIDDAFISLRYAARLVGGHGLTFSDGERVEGYSNLAWVLGCAGLVRAGLGGVLAARLFGVGAGLFAIAAVVRAYRPRAAADLVPALFAALLLATSMPLAAWAMGGLEAPLVAALAAWAVALLLPFVDDDAAHGVTLPGVVLALLTWTRPDGALLACALLGGLGLARRDRAALAVAARLGAFVAAAVVAQLAFRLAYYGQWLPNTALIKLGLGPARLGAGARYLFAGLLNLAGPVAVAAVALVVGRRRRVVLVATPLAAWIGYVLVVGGDWMPAHRLLVPALVLLALLGAEALVGLGARGRDWRIRGALGAALCLGLFVATQANDPEAPGHKEDWVWEARALGTTLRRAFATEQPLVAADSIGALGYYSELPLLDMLGLTDRHIARRPVAGARHDLIGHEHGDGGYVLDRAPDLVVFGGPRGGAPVFAGGRQMWADPRFSRDYVRVALESDGTPAVRTLAWVRRQGRIGVARAAGRIVVPAYLLSDGRVAVRLGAGGAPALALEAGQDARLGGLTLPAGRYTIAADAPAALTVTDEHGRSLVAGDGGVVVARDATVELGVRAATPLQLGRIVLTTAP